MLNWGAPLLRYWWQTGGLHILEACHGVIPAGRRSKIKFCNARQAGTKLYGRNYSPQLAGRTERRLLIGPQRSEDRWSKAWSGERSASGRASPIYLYDNFGYLNGAETGQVGVPLLGSKADTRRVQPLHSCPTAPAARELGGRLAHAGRLRASTVWLAITDRTMVSRD